jgi:colanic acid biosynthesis glycosyl transferase WcaI
LNVLIVSQYFWPENFRINDLAQELVARGHSVTVLTGFPNYPEGRISAEFLLDRRKYSSFNGVDIVRVPLVPRGSSRFGMVVNYLSFSGLACLLGPWMLRGRKTDVVLTCQLSPVTVGLVGALIARIKRARMAMWVLDLWPETLEAIGVVRSSKIIAFFGWFVGFIYRRCGLILAQSRSFIPRIQSRAGADIPVVYFPSWAEKVFVSGVITPATEVPIRSGTFNVMFAGNIGEAQDFGCILAAAELLRDRSHIRWLVVGDGRMFSWVKDQIKLRGLLDSVILLGRYPLERMPDFFVHADAMLVTLADRSIFSLTIPGKLQSYLAAGMPVVGALNGEGADVIRMANAGFSCPAGDHAGLAAIVLKMSRFSGKEREAMGNNGARFSEIEFDRDKLIDKLEGYLAGMCK